MSTRLLSLAAGVMIDIAPADVVSAAGAAGWPACGIWFDPETWSPQVQADIARRLDDTGVVALDIEPIIVGPGPDPTEGIVAAAAALGARFILFTSRVDDEVVVVERFGRACDLARAADPSITVVFEFLPIFPFATLARARQVVAQAGRPNGAVLIDNLHLRSSGATPADLVGLDRAQFPYIQIADAPREVPEGGMAALVDEAINGRSWPGDGQLPIAELLSVVPSVPISFEVRSADTRRRFPDPVDRARYGWSRVRHLAG
jgi:sugar phosphate isomerase/epimerase